MANSKGSSNLINTSYNGKHACLPPRIPLATASPSYVDFIPNSVIGSKVVQKPKEGTSRHQRTASETLVMDEQPSWLDDLLDEPETPVRQPGHRRSSSDSFAYIEGANSFNFDYITQDEHSSRNMPSMSLWSSHEFEFHKGARHASFFAENNVGKLKNRAWDLPLNTTSHLSVVSSELESGISLSSIAASPSLEHEMQPVPVSDRKNPIESPKPSSERKDFSQPKPVLSESDTKRAKQQFAQRSRVRKLQYIAELERNVQALQAEGSEFSAELEFLNQQNLILSMENKALKQRLESVTQEHLIKRLEHDVLEREIGRLKNLYQQHQQPPQAPPAGHRRSSSEDLEGQFANLSVKQKGARDSVSGPLRI